MNDPREVAQPDVPQPGEAIDLDQQIHAVREAVDSDTDNRTEALVSLLSARATLLLKADLHDQALDDLREAAGLLRGYDALPCPVAANTARFVWALLAAMERAAGRLDAALEAASRAVGVREPLPADRDEMYEAFAGDLVGLAEDLDAAGRADDREHAERLLAAWLEATRVVADPAEPPVASIQHP